MSAKRLFFAALLGICATWCSARGQGPGQMGSVPAPLLKDLSNDGTPAKAQPETSVEMGTGLSQWITYDRGNCCEGKGGGMPILTESFVRAGPTFPVGGEFFSRNLNTGWVLEGGVRAMFFNHPWSAAWNVELSISNFHNPSTSTNPIFLDHNINQFITIRSFNRTFVGAGFGREWYVWSPANSNDCRLRWGADFGGRWGSGTLEINELRHRTQVIEGIYATLHADLEIPHGRWTYLVGLRGEYDFTWSNIFAPGRGDMEDLTFLVNAGLRY